jgi:hypothetical protein
MTRQDSLNDLGNLDAFLSSWSLELRARQDRVRSLIGEAHWLSDGHHKEAIIREFLTRYLPRQHSVNRGFVKPADLSLRVSPEVDILVCDQTRHPPLFNEGGLVIVPPSSVVAHFEVKTRLSTSSLREAVGAVSRTQRAIATSANSQAVWRCVCFFGGQQADLEKDLVRIRRELEAAFANERAPLPGWDKGFTLPTCLVVVGAFVVFVRCDSAAGKCVIRLFPSREASLAYAFADMFSSITRSSGNSTNELDQMIEQSSFGPPISKEFEMRRTDGTKNRSRAK